MQLCAVWLGAAVYGRKRGGGFGYTVCRLSLIHIYAVITVLVFVGTKVVGMMAGAILPLVLTPDRAAYTVCAIVVAVVLPYIYEFFHKYLHFRVKVEKRQDEE